MKARVLFTIVDVALASILIPMLLETIVLFAAVALTIAPRYMPSSPEAKIFLSIVAFIGRAKLTYDALLSEIVALTL